MRQLFDAYPLEKLRPTTIDESSTDPNDLQQIIKYQLEYIEGGKDANEAFKLGSDRYWQEKKVREIKKKVNRQQYLYVQSQIEAANGKKVLSHNSGQSLCDTIREVMREETRLFEDIYHQSLKSQ